MARAASIAICTNYGDIHGFWWDANVLGTEDRSINNMIYELQPKAIINNRGFDEGDFGTPERDFNEKDYISFDGQPIEDYQVNLELIERVRSGKWNPNDNDYDSPQKDAMAARGYWQTFQKVKESCPFFGRGLPGNSTKFLRSSFFDSLFTFHVKLSLQKIIFNVEKMD